MLEQEGESEKLKVVREDEGFDLRRGYHNTASCVLENKIFAFRPSNYEEVFQYGLESGKWSLFYPPE